MKKQHSPLKIVEIAVPSQEEATPIPAYSACVQAGFPSSAEDYIESKLDLNNLVVKHPAATFFVRVEGESMLDANIHSGDILVVDRSLEAANGKIIVAVIDGEFTVKRLVINASGTFLCPENKKFSPIKIGPEAEFQHWGVVTYVIHKTR